MKHNKRRNTAFLYEALIKELTKASIKGELYKKSLILKTLKGFFAADSILRKELSLYNEVVNTKNLTKGEAEKLLSEARTQYKKLNIKEIFKKQSKLISIINKHIGSETFNNFVPNYKNIASVYQLFSPSTKLKNKIILERGLIHFLTRSASEQLDEQKKISNTTLKVFTQKFNKEYKDLFLEQKELIQKYISSFNDNGLELKVFLNEELGRLKEKIREMEFDNNLKEDKNLIDKSKEVLQTMDEFTGKFIDEEMLKKILKIQKLVKETETSE